MNQADERLLESLRQIRAIETDERGLGERLLEILVSTTASTSATLRRPLSGSDLSFGPKGQDGDVARLEQRFPAPSGVAVLTLERPASSPFDEGDERTLEILGGEVIGRLEQARTEAEASRLRRQIELLRTLSRTGESAARPFDVADRAAAELLRAFTGAHVLVHVVGEHHLELVARRTIAGNGLADAPDWIRVIPLDSPTVMAVAAREKKTVARAVKDIAQPRRAFLENMGIRHLLVAPLVSDDVALGSLTVAHRDDDPWDAESLRFLEGVANQLGNELAHAQVLEAERRRADDLHLINQLGGLVARHLELRDVLSTAASALSRVIDVPRVHVLLLDETKAHLRGVTTTADGVADMDLPVATIHAVVHAFRTLAPLIIDDAETDTRTNKSFVAESGARSLMIVPLVAEAEAIGLIGLRETRRKRRFTETEVARVVAVANVIAPAVTNAKMFEDLRRSYEALAKAQADLVTHERLAALGELSAVIAHEVRNPVAIIFNSLSELRRLATPAPEASLLLDIVGEETTRLNRMVGDLLDFVRPYDAHPRMVQLEVVIKGAVDAARRAAPEPGVEIRAEVRFGSRELFLDGTMLQQALLNLIVNAIQATPKGKAVSIRAEVVADADSADGESLRCEVADEGPGIDAATSTRIFQPFFTTKATGTGLGLALVRRLADALGGTVVAETLGTGGALFTLTVPLSRGSPEGPA